MRTNDDQEILQTILNKYPRVGRVVYLVSIGWTYAKIGQTMEKLSSSCATQFHSGYSRGDKGVNPERVRQLYNKGLRIIIKREIQNARSFSFHSERLNQDLAKSGRLGSDEFFRQEEWNRKVAKATLAEWLAEKEAFEEFCRPPTA